MSVRGAGSPYLALASGAVSSSASPQRLRPPALALCVCLPCIAISGEAKIALPSLLVEERAGDSIPIIATLPYPRKE